MNTLARPDITKMTLKQVDLEWQAAELEIDRLTDMEQRLHHHYNRLKTERAKRVVDELIRRIQGTISEWLSYQSDVESFLIEHEAPGWTST